MIKRNEYWEETIEALIFFFKSNEYLYNNNMELLTIIIDAITYYC